MSLIAVERWDESREGPMTLDAIRARHLPETRHRVSKSRCVPGTRFPGASRAGLCYVLEGSCRFEIGEEKIDLSAGDIASLPGGPFGFEVIGPEHVTVVKVWKLPFEVPPQKHF